MRQSDGFEPLSWSSWASVFERQDRAEKQRAADAERIRAHNLNTHTNHAQRLAESTARGRQRGRATQDAHKKTGA